MRLLDLIAQGGATAVTPTADRLATQAGAFAQAVQACPLRYVLADELVRMATALAFSEGDRLESCLDLVRVPARRLWVEWDDAPRQSALDEILCRPASPWTGGARRRSGALLAAAADGRSGEIRGFWAAPDGTVIASPISTEFDLDRCQSASAAAPALLAGGWVLVRDELDPAIDGLLSHFRHRLDPAWISYYRSFELSPLQCSAVVRGNLGGVAFDGPMLLAFFLLLEAKCGLPRLPVDRCRLNRMRARKGRAALLEHVEVRAPLERAPAASALRCLTGPRRPARLHHVRGHLVRRGATVFWRCPHLRGSAHWGEIRSRTIELS